MLFDSISKMVRAPGIEPGIQAWEAHVLPLNYARRVYQIRVGQESRRLGVVQSKSEVSLVRISIALRRGTGSAYVPP